MPSLSERLANDLKDAMRAGDALRRDEIRGVLSMLKAEQQAKLTRTLEQQGLILAEGQQLTADQQQQVDHLRATSGLTDDEEQAILVTRVVQHRQAIDAFKKGNRADLLNQEEAQLAVDATYLPQLDAAALEQAIQDAIRESGAQTIRDQGKVMPLLSTRLRGKADMKAVASRVQAILAEVS
jgi:uncharacterized protein YqeY